MAARNEKEKQKANQEKYQAILTSLLRDEDNKYCVDCDSKGPRWASWNLGIFLCIRCAGIHRNLGVHITKVKSVNLDSWTPEQIAHMQAMGNSRARAVYEANMPDGYRRPQTDSALEAFIRTKYEQRKWIAKEWVPPKIETPVVRDAEEVKEKKRTVSGGGTPRQKQSESASTTSRPRPSMPKSGSPSPAAVTTAGESSRSRPAANPNPIDELISIDDPSSSNVAPQAVPTQYSAGSGASNPILELFDEPVPSQSQGHGHSIAGQPDRPYQQSQQSPPAQFQSQPQSGGPAAAAAASGSSSSNDLIGLMGLNDKMDKQSILALYKPTSQPQSAPVYGVPGGTYVTQGGGMSITPMMGMPTSMNPQGMAPVRQPMMASQHQAMMAAQHQQMMAQQHQPMMAPQHQQFPNQQQQQQAYNPNPMMQGFNPMNQLQFQMNQMSMGAPQPAWRGPSFPAARPSFGMNTVPQGNTLSSNLWQ